MAIFTKSVLNSIKLDESKVALAWANYQQFLSKKTYPYKELFIANEK